MVKSEAWQWFTTLCTKTHPDVQCNYCGKVIRNCQLGRDLLPHASYNCQDAPPEVIDRAEALIDKAEALKLTRKPSGGAAHKRGARLFRRMLACLDEDSEEEREERRNRYWEAKARFWRKCEEQEGGEAY